MAPFGEVLSALEEARQKAWSDRSPKHSSGLNRGHRGSSNQIGSLPNSHSQPIYVPGKYSVSFLIVLRHYRNKLSDKFSLYSFFFLRTAIKLSIGQGGGRNLWFRLWGVCPKGRA